MFFFGCMFGFIEASPKTEERGKMRAWYVPLRFAQWAKKQNKRAIYFMKKVCAVILDFGTLCSVLLSELHLLLHVLWPKGHGCREDVESF